MSRFGDRLRSAREARGLTQAKLAHAIGVAAQSISNYERGVVQDPKSEHVVALARVLDVDLSALLGDVKRDAPELPYEQDEDVRWASEATGLDDLGLRKLRAVRREIGPMSRAELLMAANLIAANARARH